METRDKLLQINNPPEIISYYTMRRAIGILGITLPMILVAGSSLFGDCKDIQYSISAYYHTNMRDIFVGYNCAFALFLFAYKGHDWRDNLTGYLGSFAVLGVAFLPCSVSTAGQGCLLASSIENPLVGKLHNLSSLFYFMMLIVYALFLFPAMNQLNPEFWLETVVLFSFGISWLTKGQLLFRDENYQKGP